MSVELRPDGRVKKPEWLRVKLPTGKKHKELRGLVDKINRVVLGTDDIFWENEIKSNILVAATELNLAIVTVIAWILSYVGVFEIESREMMQVAIPVLIELLVPSLLCIFFKGKKKWISQVENLQLLIIKVKN